MSEMPILNMKILSFIICVFFTQAITAEDSAMARRMAAEIVEQAAQDNKAYREVLLDVGKALREKKMNVGEARDLLSLAVSCRELGASRRPMQSASQNFDQLVSGVAPDAKKPDMLDIDKLIDEEKITSATKEKPIFDNLKQEQAGGDNSKVTGSGTGGGYLGGLAGRRSAWDSGRNRDLPAARSTNKQPERAELSAANSKAVTDEMLKKSSSKKGCQVAMVKPGLDGLPQIVLINKGSQHGIKDRQELIISRNGQALVKAVVNRVKAGDAFAIIMPNTWANGVEKKLEIGDVVGGL